MYLIQSNDLQNSKLFCDQMIHDTACMIIGASNWVSLKYDPFFPFRVHGLKADNGSEADAWYSALRHTQVCVVCVCMYACTACICAFVNGDVIFVLLGIGTSPTRSRTH